MTLGNMRQPRLAASRSVNGLIQRETNIPGIKSQAFEHRIERNEGIICIYWRSRGREEVSEGKPQRGGNSVDRNWPSHL